jgi:hypothetical protein
VVVCWLGLEVANGHVIDELRIVAAVLHLPYFSFFYLMLEVSFVSINLLSDMSFHFSQLRVLSSFHC